VFFGNEELDIVVRYAGTGGADSIGRLLELKIPTPSGRQVPFSAIAELDEGAALAAIKRVDGKREVGVDADAYTKDNVQAINQDVKTWFETEVQGPLSRSGTDRRW
jgi:multidrug efflux pump subunit AcrB